MNNEGWVYRFGSGRARRSEILIDEARVWGYNDKDVFEFCSSERLMDSRRWA